MSAQAAPVAAATIAFDDAALVERCRGGDMQAFAALVAKYQQRVFNLIYRMVGRHADAEELAQEAFLNALEGLSQFRNQSQFYTWLFRIAANLAISHRRRSGRIRFESLSDGDDLSNSQAAALAAEVANRRVMSPPTAAIVAETEAMISQALEQLEDDFRTAVILRDVENMDYAQMAEVLQVPVGTVKSRLHRGRCALKEKLSALLGN